MCVCVCVCVCVCLYIPQYIGSIKTQPTLMTETEEELKNLLMRVKEESERAGLRLNIKKAKNMASSSITAWQIEGEKVEAVTYFFLLDSKITAYVTAAMKSEDDCFLAGKQ